MPLTNEELAEVDKLLGRMEKNAKPWRIIRWPLLVIGLLTVGKGLWICRWATTGFTEISGDPLKTITRLDLFYERMWLTTSCAAMLSGVMSACVGILVLGYVLGNWNKGKKDSLLAKLARSYVESQRSGNENRP